MTHFRRELEKYLKHYLSKYPIVTLTGPRQSGKTTLAQKSCPDYEYVSLEEPDVLDYALEDPRGFLQAHKQKVIFDEVQRAPQLFSFLQTEVDRNSQPGRFVLIGSQHFLLNPKIPQTLAGRIARLTLLPLSFAELCQRPSQSLWFTNQCLKSSAPRQTLFEALFQGQYARLFQYDLEPQQFFRDYIDTYVTKDLQQLLNVGDLHSFQTFLRMLANRSGQRINFTSLGNDLGVAHTTIKRWISVLEASYIITVLQPYYNNFNKRRVKSPKVHFLDSGLLCYLLRIKDPEDLRYHSMIGGIFESFVLSELMKAFYHKDQDPPLYFWQERNGKEIDVIIDCGQSLLLPIEVKSTQTLSSKLFDNLNYWVSLERNPQDKGYLVYGGDKWQTRHEMQVIPWFAVS